MAGRIRHVCFDKDGTLTDVHSYWAHTCSIRARTLCRRFGIPASTEGGLLDCMGIAGDKIKPGGPVGYKPRAVIVAATAALLGKSPEEITAVFAEVDALQQRTDDYRVDALAGAREALALLKAKGLKLSVYTSDRAENARKALAAAGMSEYLDVVVGGDGVKEPKPHPEGFELACRSVGVAASESAYVGDTLDDLKMAAAAGALPVGVGTGLCTLSQLREAGSASIEDLRGLEAALA